MGVADKDGNFLCQLLSVISLKSSSGGDFTTESHKHVQEGVALLK